MEGMVVDPVGRALYWTCSSTLGVMRAALPGAGTGAGAGAARVLRVVALAPGDRPRGIDIDSCDECVSNQLLRPTLSHAFTFYSVDLHFLK